MTNATVIETGRSEAGHRIEHHQDAYYGEYWAAVRIKTGRPHMMRDTREEAEADLDALAAPEYNWN